MHPIFDADALLLLAITIASKRKPATLDEVVVGLAMVQPKLPAETRLLEAFTRLSRHGLISARDGGYTLCAAAEKIMMAVPKKKEFAEQAFCLKAKLAEFEAEPSEPAVQPEAADLTAAIAAWQASLPPPTKTEKFEQRKLEQRGPGAARRFGASAGYGKPGGPRSPRKRY